MANKMRRRYYSQSDYQVLCDYSPRISVLSSAYYIAEDRQDD